MRDHEERFALECIIADNAGDWPEEATAPPPEEWLARSPTVAAAYARRLARDGRFGEAKPLLAFAVRGFARSGAAGALRAGIAWLADVGLHLGDVAEAETGLRFLQEETELPDDGGDSRPDVWFALGRGGFLLGLSVEERLRRFEEAAIGFAGADRRERALAAAFEWKRLSEAAEIPAEAGAPIIRTMRQKAAWHPAYLPHAKLLEVGLDASALEEAFGASDYYRALAEALRLRLRLSTLGGAELDREAERAEAARRERFPGDLELQAEELLRTASRHARAGRAGEAKAALADAEALLPLGLPPEYRRAISRAAALVEGPTAAPREGAPVRVRCFGELALERAGEPIAAPRWKRKKAQELFLLLLLRPGHAMPKEHAIDALFGSDAEPVKAANQLYVAIHEIRRALKEALGWGEGAVLRDGVVSLPEASIEEVDAEKYVTLVRVADRLQLDQPELSEELYETAAELYGPLLPNKPYLEWLDRQRDELERLQSRVLERLYRAALRRSDMARAERYARAWSELDPHREEPLQALLELLTDAGRKSEAESLYEAFERRLRDELGAKPSPETRRLLGASASVRKM